MEVWIESLARKLFSPGCRETEDWPSRCSKLDTSTDRLSLDVTGSFDTSNIRPEELYTPSPTYNKLSNCYRADKYSDARFKILDHGFKLDGSITGGDFDVTTPFDADNIQVGPQCISPVEDNIVKCDALDIAENDCVKTIIDSSDSLIDSSSLKLDADVSMEVFDAGSCLKQDGDDVVEDMLIRKDCDIPVSVTVKSDIINAKTEDCDKPTELNNSLLDNDMNSSQSSTRPLNNNVFTSSSPEKSTLDSTLKLFLESSLTKLMHKRKRPPMNKKRKMFSGDVGESPSQTLSGSLINAHDLREKRPMCSTPKLQSILSSEKKNRFGSGSKRVRFAICPDLEEDAANVIQDDQTQLTDDNPRCRTHSVSKYQKSSQLANDLLKINSQCLLNGKHNHKMAHVKVESTDFINSMQSSISVCRSDDDMFSQISPDALEHMMVSVTEPVSFRNSVRNRLQNSKSHTKDLKPYSSKFFTSDVVLATPDGIVSKPEKRTVINKKPIKQEIIVGRPIKQEIIDCPISNIQRSAMQITPIKSINDDMFTQISPDAVDSLLSVVESCETSHKLSPNASSECVQKAIETQNLINTSEVKPSINQNTPSAVHCNNDAKNYMRNNIIRTCSESIVAKDHNTNKVSKLKQTSFSHRRKVKRFSYPSGSQIKHTHPERVYSFKLTTTTQGNREKSKSLLQNDDDVLEAANKCSISKNDDSSAHGGVNNDVSLSADAESHTVNNKLDILEHNHCQSYLPLPAPVIADGGMNGAILQSGTTLPTFNATKMYAAPTSALTKIASRKQGLRKFSDIVQDCHDLWDESFSDPSCNNHGEPNESTSITSATSTVVVPATSTSVDSLTSASVDSLTSAPVASAISSSVVSAPVASAIPSSVVSAPVASAKPSAVVSAPVASAIPSSVVSAPSVLVTSATSASVTSVTSASVTFVTSASVTSVASASVTSVTSAPVTSITSTFATSDDTRLAPDNSRYTELDVVRDDKRSISRNHRNFDHVPPSDIVNCAANRRSGIKSGNLHSGSLMIPESKNTNGYLELTYEKMDISPVINRPNAPSNKHIGDMNSADSRVTGYSGQSIPSCSNTSDQCLDNNKEVTHIGFTSAKGCALNVSPKSLNMANRLVSEVDNYSHSDMYATNGVNQKQCDQLDCVVSCVSSKVARTNLVPPRDTDCDADGGNSHVLAPINLANRQQCTKLDVIGFTSAKGGKLSITSKSLSMARKLISEDDDDYNSHVSLSINSANTEVCLEPENIGFTSGNGRKIVVSPKSLTIAKKLVCEEDDCNSDVMRSKGEVNKSEVTNMPCAQLNVPYAQLNNIGFTSAKGKNLDISAKSLIRAKKLVSEVDENRFSMNIGEPGIVDGTHLKPKDTEMSEGWTESSKTNKTFFEPFETASGKAINISSTNLHVDKAEKLIMSDIANDLVTNNHANVTVENTSHTSNSKLSSSGGRVTSFSDVPPDQMLAGGFQTAGGHALNVDQNSFMKVHRIFSDIENEMVKDFGGTLVPVSIEKPEFNTLAPLKDGRRKQFLSENKLKGKQLLPKGFRPFKAPRIIKTLTDSSITSAISESSTSSHKMFCKELSESSNIAKDCDSLQVPNQLLSIQTLTKHNTGTSLIDSNFPDSDRQAPSCSPGSPNDTKHYVLLNDDSSNLNNTVSKVEDDSQPKSDPANSSELLHIDASVDPKSTSSSILHDTAMHNVIKQKLNNRSTCISSFPKESNQKCGRTDIGKLTLKAVNVSTLNSATNSGCDNRRDNIRHSIEMDFDDLNTQQWMSEISECDSGDGNIPVSKHSHRRLPTKVLDQQATCVENYQSHNNNTIRHASMNQIYQARAPSTRIPSSYKHPQLDSSNAIGQQITSNCIQQQSASHIITQQPPSLCNNKEVELHSHKHIQSEGSSNVSHPSSGAEYSHVKSTNNSTTSSIKNSNQYVNAMASFSTASGNKVNISIKSLADAKVRFNDDVTFHSSTLQAVTACGDSVVPQCDVQKGGGDAVHCVSSAGDVPCSGEVMPVSELPRDNHHNTIKFESASDNDLCISENSLIKAKQTLNSHTVDTFGADITNGNLNELASFDIVLESHDCLLDSKTNILKTVISPPCHTGTLFLTASGSDVHVSAAALKTATKSLNAARQTLHGDSDLNSFLTSMSRTDDVTIRSHDIHSCSNNDDNTEISEKERASIFQTASGNHVEISSEALSAVRKQINTDICDEMMDGLGSFPRTSSNNDVDVFMKAKNANNKGRFDVRHGAIVPNHVSTLSNCLFQTASGNSVEISRSCLEKARYVLSKDSTPVTNSPHERECLSDQSVPVINQHTIEEKASSRSGEFINHQLSIRNSERASLFQTASGHDVEISQDALRSVRSVLGNDVNCEITESRSLPSAMHSSVFQTASGESVTVSKSALDSAYIALNNQERISPNTCNNIMESENTGSSLFHTASGFGVEVSRKALKNVRKFFSDDVDSDIALATTMNTSLFQTASGHNVSVSKSALDSVRETLNEKERTSFIPIPQSGNAATGCASLFQTASGGDVSVSSAALAQVKLFLNKDGTDETQKLTPTLNTANNAVANNAIARKPQRTTSVAKDHRRPIGDSPEQEERCCDVPSDCDESISMSSQVTVSTSSSSASEMQASSRRLRTSALKRIPYKTSPQGCLGECPSRQGHVFKPVRSLSLATKHSSNNFLGTRVSSPDNEGLKTDMKPFSRDKSMDFHGASAAKGDITGSVKPTFQTPYKVQSSSSDSKSITESGNMGETDGSPHRNTHVTHDTSVLGRCANARRIMGDQSDKGSSTPNADNVTTDFIEISHNCGDKGLLGGTHSIDCNRTVFNSERLNSVKGTGENSACKPMSRDNDINVGSITDSLRFEWESARMRQDKEIRLKKKQNVRPLSGKLWSQRQNTASRERLSLEDVIDVSQTGRYQAKEFYSMGVQRSTLAVRASNAELYKFNLHLFYGSYLMSSTDGVLVGDGIRLISADDGTAGKYEFYRAFLSASGVDPRLISEAWLYNHYRWIIWKLAAYEFLDPLQFAGRSLTPDNVMLQLKFRYDKEVDHCHRSALRRIYERDDTPAKRLVLCVSALMRDTPGSDATDCHTADKDRTSDSKEVKSQPQTVLELTDGWYSIKACLDPVLENVISSGRISVGDKLCTCGAELTGSEAACTPLEAPDAIRLKIHGNSTRRARWDAKLGYQQQPRPMFLPLSSLRVNGGTVGCVDVVVVRVYPELFMERLVTGGCVFRNRRTEMRSADEYKTKQQSAMEELYSKIEQQQQQQQDKDKTCKDAGRRCRGTKYTKKQIEALHTGAEIYDMMNTVLDPDSVQCLLNQYQLQRLHDHQQELMDRKRRKLEQEFQKALHDPEQVYPARNVVPLIKIRLAGCHQTDVDLKSTCILTMWRPSNVTSILCEGKRFRVTSLSATQNRSRMSKCSVQLTALRGTRFTEVPVDENFLDLVYEPREVWQVKDLLLSRPPYDEVDFVGVVLAVSDRNEKQCQMVYACDSEGDVFAVRFWDGLKSQSLDDLFQPHQTFAAINLILRQSRCRTRIATLDMCTERSQFTQNPSLPALKHALTQLKQSLKEPDFLGEAQLRLEDVSGITVGSQAVKTTKQASSSGTREYGQPLRNPYTTPISRRSSSPLNITEAITSPSLVTNSCERGRTMRPDSPIMPLNRQLVETSPMNTTVRIHSPPVRGAISNNTTPVSRISGIRKRKQLCIDDVDSENVSRMENTNDRNVSMDTNTPNDKLKFQKFSSCVSSPGLSSITHNNLTSEEVERQTRVNHGKCAKLSRYGMAPVLSPLVATISNSVKKAFRPPRKL